jgi:hypothetical protein
LGQPKTCFSRPSISAWISALGPTRWEHAP